VAHGDNEEDDATADEHELEEETHVSDNDDEGIDDDK
jgi:hypothetical protein